MKTKTTYIIKYTAYSRSGVTIKQGSMKVKNRENKIAAQVALEKYFDKRLPLFHRLVVHSCKNESILDMFSGIFGKS